MSELERIGAGISQPERTGSRQVSGLPSTEPKCKVCNDTGWLQGEFSKELRLCECQEEKERISRIAGASLPPGTENWTFKTFKKRLGTEKAYVVALQLAEGKSDVRWLTIVAGVDRGKSHLAIAIARRWLEGDQPCRYEYVPSMLNDLRQGFDPHAEVSFDRQFGYLCKIPLLILDDLGVEDWTRKSQEMLDALIDYRYLHQLHLVVTTNLPLTELSPRIASRLQRIGSGKVVVIDAPEYRIYKEGSE